MLGTFSIYHGAPRDVAPADLELIDEFGRIAGLAVPRVRQPMPCGNRRRSSKATRDGVLITDLTPRHPGHQPRL